MPGGRSRSDAAKQLRQRNMDRAFQMIPPFLGRSHIQDDRTLRAFHEGEKISSSNLRNLLRLVQIISGDKPHNLIKPNPRKLELSSLRLRFVFHYQ
jgi:hypothetical protein